ncbi:hypothetical protein KY290_010883 [Solanum tuberosum]|uniref:Retrotransposon gag domain-containing protein n=1 Tax=Solanum tuberosum TaxID=4113 RepID=A0ABQ7W099_SOLTU|nr:hypothetical protein KY290_010883 [Solanum tuberosum]
MVTNIKGKPKEVTITMTKVEMEVEMLGSTLSRLVSHISKRNAIPMLISSGRYAITWWEYMKRYHQVVQDGHPPPWTGLKALIRVKYVSERLSQELLAKLYNLRQGSISVATYDDEFRNLILK